MLDRSHLPVGLVKLSVEGEGQTLPSTPAWSRLDQYLKAGEARFFTLCSNFLFHFWCPLFSLQDPWNTNDPINRYRDKFRDKLRDKLGMHLVLGGA